MATAQTPTKGVHWGVEPNFYSPSTDASSEILSTSSLEYINSQLVAHGFAPAPGLSLDARCVTVEVCQVPLILD